ncbi:hypothetical protein ADICEAN_02439 [Cesiribacter andamanensis AMV16]|uniref:Uncharacterized protein n=1 Tax=Cesiribacter andamanensis AMV16 TaxID=1279009 RepID=M7N199_9BACT|nr:hypothetical protein ADICEAN_02439 [Cesiribacter andamanensis AMV16]
MKVVHRTYGPVNGYLGEVFAAEAVDLRIDVGKQTALQQGVVGEIDAWHHIAGVEGHLLGFGKEIVRVAVQYHLAYFLYGYQFFGNDFGGIQQVEAKFVLIFFFHHLHTEFKLGIIAHVNGIPQIAAKPVGVFAGQFLGLIPHQGMNAQYRFPMQFYKTGLALGVDPAKGVYSKAFHVGKAAGYGPVGEYPHEHMGRFRHQGGKIPEGVMRGRGLWHFIVGHGLDGMHKINELDAILDKEYRHVVAYQVVIAFLGIELCCKTPHIPHRIGRASGAHNGREAHKDGCLYRGIGEKLGLGILSHGFIGLKIAMGP